MTNTEQELRKALEEARHALVMNNGAVATDKPELFNFKEHPRAYWVIDNGHGQQIGAHFCSTLVPQLAIFREVGWWQVRRGSLRPQPKGIAASRQGLRVSRSHSP